MNFPTAKTLRFATVRIQHDDETAAISSRENAGENEPFPR